MQSLHSRLRAKLEARQASNQRRHLQAAPAGIDFCSNDYLGLSRDHALRRRHAEAMQSAPALGSTGSRLISGNSLEHEALEHSLATWLGYETGLLMHSGYSANLGLLSCIAEREDTLLLDSLAHASLIDGARLSAGRRLKFAHNDLDDLQQKLQAPRRGQCFVVVESIYSMDGDRAPLAEIATLCDQYHASLIVDEAHAIGVLGDEGEGLVAQLGLQEHVLACVFTFGKAPGCHGALIAGSTLLRDYLLNFCRPFIYTTAQPPEQLLSIRLACEQLRAAADERAQLRAVIAEFRRCVGALNCVELLPSDSPIQGVLTVGAEHTHAVSKALQQRGFAVYGITAPTVAPGSERLRICLHSHNTLEQVHALAHALREILSSRAEALPCA